jgi:hypothetical protein
MDEANNGEVCLLLSKRKNGSYYERRYVLVSSEDFERVSSYKWCLDSDGYAVGCMKKEGGGWKTFKMHRFIINAAPGELVDHKDGDRLNNTRSNLRICTHTENMRNRKKQPAKSSKYLGVCYQQKTGRWRVQFWVDKKQMSFGSYATEDEAGRVAMEKRKEYHGAFASFVPVK